MAKQTLYEILGVNAEASNAEIDHAFAQQNLLIEANPDLEYRNNQLQFIQHARYILTDEQARAQYDRQINSEQIVEIHGEVIQSDFKLKILLLTAILGSMFLGWHFYQIESQKQPTIKIEALASNTPAEPIQNDETKDVVFETPPPTKVAMEAASQDQSLSSQNTSAPTRRTFQVHSSAKDADLIKKLVWSVYAIVGTSAFGTGVLIDSEHLLTNCHVIASNVRKGKIYAINAVTKDKVEVTEVTYVDNQDACMVRVAGVTGQPVTMGNLGRMSTGFRTHSIGYVRGNLSSSEGYFAGWAYKFGQKLIVTNNYCDHGVSGGPLVDDDGNLLGLTSGGPADKSYCLSVTVDTLSELKYQMQRPLNEFPDNYSSNISRRS